MIGWIKRQLRAFSSTGMHPRDPALRRWFYGSSMADAGVSVDEHTALTYSAVWAAVRRICDSFALPIRVYQRLPDGVRREVDEHPVAKLFRSQPNNEMTWFTLQEVLQAHVLLWGNAYAEIVFENGHPVELWPLTPNRVVPQRVNNELLYYIYPGHHLEHQRPTHVLKPWQLIHVKGLGFDGIKGYSVVEMAKQSIGLGLAEEQFGAKYFGNGARPDGVLQTPDSLSEDAQKRLRDQWEELYGGPSRAGRIAVLEEGMQYSKITIPPNDSQFLESRSFQIADIARWFNIQPHMIGDLSRSTFSNIEVQGQEFVTYTLRPWFVRWEQELNVKLWPFEQGIYETEFDADELIRGTIQTRYGAYNTGRNGGWLSFNDVRRSENLPTVDEEWADQYWWPLNIGVAGEPAPVTEQPSPVEPGIDPVTDPEIAEDIATALNGAQVTALVDVVQQVFSGQIPVSAAVGIITASFPIEQEEAEKILTEAEVFVPTPKGVDEGRGTEFDESKHPRRPDGKFGSGGTTSYSDDDREFLNDVVAGYMSPFVEDLEEVDWANVSPDEVKEQMDWVRGTLLNPEWQDRENILDTVKESGGDVEKVNSQLDEINAKLRGQADIVEQLAKSMSAEPPKKPLGEPNPDDYMFEDAYEQDYEEWAEENNFDQEDFDDAVHKFEMEQEKKFSDFWDAVEKLKDLMHGTDDEVAKILGLRKATRRPRLRRSATKFDESKHPRRPDGKFGSGGGEVHEVTEKDLVKDKKFSDGIVKVGKVALKLANAMPETSRYLMKKAGYSEKVQKAALIVATIGDWSVPGIPAGSALVSAFAVSTVSYKLAKKAVDAVKSKFKRSESRMSDEELTLAVAEFLHSSDNFDGALAVFGAALDATNDVESALELAKQAIEELGK